MRSSNSSFGEKISTWKVIHTNLEPKMAEMPHLVELREQLQGVITRAEALDSLAEVNRQRRAEIARDRRKLVREGDEVRSRAAAHLKGSFGFTSEQLIEFGITPVKPVNRRRKKKAEAPTVEGANATPAKPSTT